MKTVILTTCQSSFEAHLIKHQLENDGIECFFANENFATMMPHYYRILGNGVQIFVDEGNFERAVKIITKKIEFNQQIVCPNCGSSNITFGLGKKKVAKWIWVAFSLFIGTPFNNLNNRYLCNECQTEFKNNIG